MSLNDVYHSGTSLFIKGIRITPNNRYSKSYSTRFYLGSKYRPPLLTTLFKVSLFKEQEIFR